LLERIRRLPVAVQAVALEGTRRMLDYQDPAYAELYLDRLESFAALEARLWADAGSYALLRALARSLALWMSFEDTIRVADLKTRGSRIERVREEVRADSGQLFGITEFMKPRVEEIAGTMPAGMGRWMLSSPRAKRWLTRFTSGRQIRTRTVSGFLLLHVLGGLRRWRRGTLRFQEENGRIEAWLARIESLAADNYLVAVELANAQRLVKGYGETHERGWRNFSTLLEQVDLLASRSDGGTVLARLIEAALADEEGAGLRKEIVSLRAGA
jgi:indolepyruvate ferredoxin oxidoreductase beta subunit